MRPQRPIFISDAEPEASTKTYASDLAISAVPFDAILVADLLHVVAPRVRLASLSPSLSLGDADRTRLLSEGESRVALVLYQRLWGREPLTRLDVPVIRERLRHRGASVVFVKLDDTPLPDWISGDRSCDLATVGVEGAAQMVFDAIAAEGGSLREPAVAETGPASPPRRLPTGTWSEQATPFLAGARAHGVLRRELELLAVEAQVRLHDRRSFAEERTVEVHATPDRLIARVDDVALSFSWLGGRSGSASDGRLLVIEWTGLAAQTRGPTALKSGEPVRECEYRAEAVDGLSWRWRGDGPHGRAYSSADLVGDWLSGAALALTSEG